jgi:hypothetical protein
VIGPYAIQVESERPPLRRAVLSEGGTSALRTPIVCRISTADSAGNVILLGRDKGAEMVLEIQSTACRD